MHLDVSSRILYSREFSQLHYALYLYGLALDISNLIGIYHFSQAQRGISCFLQEIFIFYVLIQSIKKVIFLSSDTVYLLRWGRTRSGDGVMIQSWALRNKNNSETVNSVIFSGNYLCTLVEWQLKILEI